MIIFNNFFEYYGTLVNRSLIELSEIREEVYDLIGNEEDQTILLGIPGEEEYKLYADEFRSIFYDFIIKYETAYINQESTNFDQIQFN